MPTYDFICEPCEVVKDEIRTYEDRKRQPACPKCGEPMLFMFPAPAFHFEGGSPTAKSKAQVSSKEQFFEGADDDF